MLIYETHTYSSGSWKILQETDVMLFTVSMPALLARRRLAALVGAATVAPSLALLAVVRRGGGAVTV